MMLSLIVFASCCLFIAHAYGYYGTAVRSCMRSHLGSTLQMKKGKGQRIPINQRGEYMKRQKMIDAKNAMEANRPSGVPIFKLYVRPKFGGMWVPCGDLAGDERAKSMVNAWMSGFMSDMYKSNIDKGVARSLFNQGDAFSENLIKSYKPFKNFKPADLEFGYKVEYEGLEEKLGEQKMTLLSKGMEKGLFDSLKEGFNGLFGN